MGISTFSQQTVNTGLTAPIGSGNAIINGAFDIWQRGTSFQSQAGLASPAYTADRFHFYRNTGNTGATLSRRDSTLLGFQYVARLQRDSGTSSTTGINLRHTVETSNSIQFAGRPVTFSFFARAGANYSPTNQALEVLVATGTGVDQAIYSFSGYNPIVSTIATLTTSWQRFSFTAIMPASAKQIGVQLQQPPTGTAGTDDWFEVTGIQLEEGTTATSFSRAGGTIQGELAECQRYFQNFAVPSGTTDFNFPIVRESSTVAVATVALPVTLRSLPTIIAGSLGRMVFRDGSFNVLSVPGVTSVVVSGNGPSLSTITLIINHGALGGMTYGEWDLLNTTTNFSFSAEIT